MSTGAEAPSGARPDAGRDATAKANEARDAGAVSTTFARGLEVLAAMIEQPSRVDELARRVGLPLSTAYRYVRTAKTMGFLDERDGTYVPGIRLLLLARQEHWHQRLATLAEPVLQALVHSLQETAFLLVREGIRAVCLASVETPRSVRLSFDPGAVRQLYAGASAKTLLAFAPPSIITEVIRGGLEPITPLTPDEATLRRQLVEIGDAGFGVSTGELDPDATAVAVPVITGDELICVLSVAGPASRFKDEYLATARKELLDAARTLAAMVERDSQA